MASAIIIGVGSTGLHILEQAQQYYYQLTGQCSPNATDAAMLFIETDDSAEPQRTPIGTTAIQKCSIKTTNLQADLNNWRTNYDKYFANGLPTNANLLDAGVGAGGMSSFGRIALWQNAQIVLDTINSVYQQVHGDKDTQIFIVGSFTGGTGSGIFIDLAYLIRKVIVPNDFANLNGMFILPGKAKVGTPDKPFYTNTYASLRSLDRYTRQNSAEKNKTDHSNEDVIFSCKFPNGSDISSAKSAFDWTQFLTPDFANGNASLTNLNQLIQSAGFNLCLQYIDSCKFTEFINRRKVDYIQNINIGSPFASIGFAAFQYPEASLNEYFATDLAVEMATQWVDSVNYFDYKDECKKTISSLKSSVDTYVGADFDKIIEKSIEKAKGMVIAGSPTLDKYIGGEVNRIINNSANEAIESAIFKLFSSQSNQLYPYLLTQSDALRSYIIDDIAIYINKISTDYQNLFVVREWLFSINKKIDNTLLFWDKRYRIDGDSTTWQKRLKNFVEQQLSLSLYAKTLDCKKQYLHYVISSLAEMCYFHFLIPQLLTIQNAISEGLSLVSLNRNELPTISACDNRIAMATKMIDDKQINSIAYRRSTTAGYLSNNHPQITYLFQQGTFENDVAQARNRYNQLQQQSKYQYSDVTNGKSLWLFLSSEIMSISNEMVVAALRKVQQFGLFENCDIETLFDNMPNNTFKSATNDITVARLIPAMVSLDSNYSFKNQTYLHTILATSKKFDNEKCIARKLSWGVDSNDEYEQVVGLKNTIIFYKIYAYLGQNDRGVEMVFNPLVHLSYQNQVLGDIKTAIDNNQYDCITRLPYISLDTLTDTANIKIK